MATTAQEIALMKRDIEQLTEAVGEMDDKLDALIKSLLDPDIGYVTRVNRNTEFRMSYQEAVSKIAELENWKNTVSKALWFIYAALTGGLIKILFFI
jgi:hypothetical protein